MHLTDFYSSWPEKSRFLPNTQEMLDLSRSPGIWGRTIKIMSHKSKVEQPKNAFKPYRCHLNICIPLEARALSTNVLVAFINHSAWCCGTNKLFFPTPELPSHSIKLDFNHYGCSDIRSSRLFLLIALTRRATRLDLQSLVDCSCKQESLWRQIFVEVILLVCICTILHLLLRPSAFSR